MVEKLNDYFLNLLSNPTFNANDFVLVGLSIDNTSLQDKNTYLNSNYIKGLDIFKTNGEFDESKFNNFYDYAKLSFQDLAKIKENEDLGQTWRAYRNDISMPENLRDNSPQFKILKVANPLRQQEGFVTFGLKENPTQSIREIAQTQSVYDPETDSWKESPNETWFDNFINPKVLATWDEDGSHKDPITGETVNHKKGDRKLNINGTYYYEDLGNRSVYGKEVLSAFDTLTTDGSTWNKLDFLDSDDLEKSFGGSMMRAAAQIVPAFIPGVGEWYIGARVALGLSQIIPAVGKTLESFAGIDTSNSFLNKIEALDKALSFSLSDYVQGSQTDDGQVLQNSHLWSWETGLKLIADVFTQLAEQRWMFEKATSAFSGLNKEVIYSKEAQQKWMEDYIAKNSKNPNLEEILRGISKGASPETTKYTAQNVNWFRAQQALLNKLEGALKLGSKLSMAYMTGITTASSYGEAKLQGASDLEAALFTLGYTLGEWKLLNSDLGKWILPELKSEERHMTNVISKSMPKIKAATEAAETGTEIGRAKWYQKLFQIGKNAYHNNLGQGIGSEALGMTISNMASEALEETSEELLLDLSKTLFNAGTSLVGSNTKFDDAFENIFDRYALSFIGGAVGGGIAGTLPAYRLARADRSITQEAATKELVDFVLLGKELQLLDTVDKMTFGSRDLDENGNQVDDYAKSQDYAIKQNFKRLINDIKDILTVNGANLDKDSLLKEFGKDVRYGLFSTLASEKSNAVGWYLNRYNELSSQLVAKSLELKKLERSKSDELERTETSEDLTREKTLKDEIKEIKEELDKFKDGTMSDEFIQDSLFEMISKISGVYIPTIEQIIKKETGKTIDELNDAEREEWIGKFNDSRPIRRDLMRMARQVHIQNMEWLSKAITNYNEEYFQSKEGLVSNLEKVIFGDKAQLDSEFIVPQLESYLSLRTDEINEFLKRMLESIISSLDAEQQKRWNEKINEITGQSTSFLRDINSEDRQILKTIPKTLEELEALDEDARNAIFGSLQGFGVNSNASLDFYTLEDEDDEGNVTRTLKEDFLLDIRGYERKAREELASLFNGVFMAFLSDPNIKQEIIKRLSSAKYINPSVKQALTNFFTTTINGYSIDSETLTPLIDEETLEIEIQNLQTDKESLILEYLDSFKDKPSSPVDIYLNNVVATLKSKGIQIAPLVADMEQLVSALAKARNLDSFAYTDEIEKTIDLALQVIELAKVGLDSAATTINGDLSDAFGFNVTVNEIRSKRGSKKEKLATIPADIAEGIKLDIEKYEQALLEFKGIQAYNSNLALKEHDKSFKIQNINLYNKLKTFIGHLEAGDWDDVDKLKLSLESSEFKDLLEEDQITPEYKDKLTKARIELDTAIHDFFEANKEKLESDRGIEMIQSLLKGLNFSFEFGKDLNTVINSTEKSLPDKDLLWYLASMAAADPKAILSVYSKVISAEYAPVIGLEEAIRTAASFLVNPKMFKLFADAYNANILEKANSDEKYRKDQAPYLLINAFRSIFIEGLPGAGKSTAVLKTITDIVNEIKPSQLKNVIIVSNTKQNSETLSNNLRFAEGTTVQTFGIEEFKAKIMNGYKTFDVDSSGALIVEQSDVRASTETPGSYEYSNFTLNADGLDGTFLIIDEATSLSQMDALMIDKFQESKGIYGLYAGDFDQIGLSGKIDLGNSKYGLISQESTNYITTHKLGLVIRGNNTYKSDDVVKLHLNKEAFIRSLIKDLEIIPIQFSYYFDDSGVYGDIVAKYDKQTTTNGNVYDLDLGTKTIISKMIATLAEGEKINYIYDDENSEMYKYLMGNYADKINKVSTKAALSQEGLYYIVDIAIKEGLERSASSLIGASNSFKNLYTAVSRAKLATLIYDRHGNNETISNRINSIRRENLTHSNIGFEARKKYAEERVSALKRNLNEADTELTLNWESKPPKTSFTPPPPSDGSEDSSNEEDADDGKTDSRNVQKEPDITNESEGTLNMMIHSFNTYEIAGTVNDKGELEISERHGERTDTAHGIIKALNLKLEDSGNGILKLSKSDTDLVISIIHKIRRAGLYGTTTSEIKDILENAFPVGKTVTSFNFIYKNSQKNRGGIPRGAISKFFRGVRDFLTNLFNLEPNETIETPPFRTIGIEVFVDGLQIEIPLGVFTSPETLVTTKGFELMNEIYKGCSTLKEFESKLKKLKSNEIPHLNDMLDFLEVYNWNYDGHPTNDLNWIVRFPENFVLNTGHITGVQTPPLKRGEGYRNKELYYEGKRMSLDEYRRKMPLRKISDIYENLSNDVKDSEGNVVLEHGIPFILVSDYYDAGYSDELLYKEYIKQVTTPDSTPRITRVYVYLPTESIDYFLYNLQLALSGDENKSASEVDNAIGNKLTSYRLLSFMLLENSNFINAFNDYIDNNKGTHPFSEEQKDLSKKRLERLQEIVRYINEYENSLIEDYSQGSKSKLILNFLNLTPEAIKSQHPELYKLFWGNPSLGTKNIGDTKWTIRTILLYEFRKLLFSGTYYEDKNSSPSLHGQIFEIERGSNDSFIYKDFQLDRINALKKDAERNNWKGVMFHSSLEKESEIVASSGSNSYKIARINAEGASFISSKPIEINGKLDGTAVIRNVMDMITYILDNLVIGNLTEIRTTSSKLAGVSDARKREIYNANTGAYLAGEPRNKVPNKEDELLNQAQNLLDSSNNSDTEVINKIKNYILNNGTNITPEELIAKVFPPSNTQVVIKEKGKFKIVKINPDSQLLVLEDNEGFVLRDQNIYYVSNQNDPIIDIDFLTNLLSDIPGRKFYNNAKSIISNRINQLRTAPELKFDTNNLFLNIFGDKVDVDSFLLFKQTNKKTLTQFNVITIDNSVPPKTIYDVNKYLSVYLACLKIFTGEIPLKEAISILKLNLSLIETLAKLGYTIKDESLLNILVTELGKLLDTNYAC